MSASIQQDLEHHHVSRDDRAEAASRRAAAEIRAARHGEALAALVETRVIPRLVLEARAAPPVAQSPAARPCAVAEAEIAGLTALCLGPDEAACIAAAVAVQARGIALESVCLDLLAPVARALGQMWKDDEADFLQVTVGVGRLTRAMYRLAALDPPRRPPLPGRRILLLPASGEQHTFGLSMVAEFFRRAGWRVMSSPGSGRAELEQHLAADTPRIVGFSVSCDTPLATLADTIRLVRRRAHTDVAVFVGGPAIEADPALARRLGADAASLDGRRVVADAEALLTLHVGAV